MSCLHLCLCFRMIKLIKPAISQAQRKKRKRRSSFIDIESKTAILIEEFCLSESGENGKRNMVKLYNVQLDILFAFHI